MVKVCKLLLIELEAQLKLRLGETLLVRFHIVRIYQNT
jgi:hypothetical protein